MSDPRLISPMLDGFALGGSMSCHSGVCCYPAMRNDSDERYIVKKISIPASQLQLDALLLTGAYPDETAAKGYFQELAKDIRDEVEILDRLSAQRGFLPYSKYQIVPMEDRVGYEVYLLSPYKLSLARQLKTTPLTHLSAVNMGIDLCAALSVCRASGYLYVDLKPENIFLSENQEYYIGDLGFVDLNSLKYASLPDRYRSDYVPPEIADAYATLNTSMDTYALGLILYQVYNNGELPFDSEENRKLLMEQLANGETLPPPAYADYEMAEIILKACAYSPEDRWDSPKEMGHALIAYMQRNAVNDVPIIPPVVDEPIMDPPAEVSIEDLDGDAVEDDVQADSDGPSSDDPETEGSTHEDEDSSVQESTETETDWIDRMGTILAEDERKEDTEVDSDEPSLRELLEPNDASPDEISAEELTGEAAEILNQAQELIEHETPEPAVAPDPIDVPIPAPIILDDDEDNADAPCDSPDEAEEVTNEVISEIPADDSAETKSKPNLKKIFSRVAAVVALAAVLYGGYFAYSHYYLVPVHGFTLAGKDDVLTVTVETDRNEDLITVICKDNFGNVERAAVENGQATFKALTPGSQYLVTLEVEKHHRLTGQVREQSYSTPSRTQVVSFSATAGPEDGSAVVNFAVEGPDSANWTLYYSTEGEEEKSHSFTGHTTTISGLTLGSTYTFRLSASDDVFLIGENSIKFFSGELVFAENLSVFNSEDGSLTATWSAPEGAQVESWIAHCYNEDGYDQTLEVTKPEAVFTDTSVSSPYTLEITAKGMSESKAVNITANPITITKLHASSSGAGIDVNWDYQGAAPENGWKVVCTSGNTSVETIVDADSTSATVSPAAPGSHYEVSIQTVDGSSVFGKTASVDTGDITAEFSAYRLSSSNISVTSHHAPESENWGRKDLDESTTTFAPGSKMALRYFTGSIYDLSDTKLTSMFVIRNAEGQLVSMSSHTRSWDDMWDSGYCVEEISELPADPGSYTLDIYINDMKLTSLNFTIE